MYFRDDYGKKTIEGFDSVKEAVEDFFEECAEYGELNADGTFTGDVEFFKGIDSDGDYEYAVKEGGSYTYFENVTPKYMTEVLEEGYWEDDWTQIDDWKHFNNAWFTVDENNGVLISPCDADDFSDLEEAERECKENERTLERHDHDFSITEATEEEPDPYDCGYCSWADLVHYYEQGNSASRG